MPYPLRRSETAPSHPNQSLAALSNLPDEADEQRKVQLDSSRSWIVALMAHLTMFTTWGFVNAFGIFQTYYVREMQIGGESNVAWIGSTQLCLVFCIGVLSGRGLDAGYYRMLYFGGSITFIGGMFALSFCRAYWQVFLTHAVCTGIGIGAIFAPTVALAGTYFAKYKFLAIGLVAMGSAAGAMVFAAIAAQMLPTAGFAWTVRTMGFLQLGIIIPCAIGLKPHTAPRPSGPLIEWDTLRTVPYILTLCASFLLFLSVFVGFYFVGTYGRNIIGVSQTTAVYLLLVLNGVGIPARILVSWVALRYSPLNVMIAVVLLDTLVGYCWVAVRDQLGLWVFTVGLGIVAAVPQSLFPMVLNSFSDDPRKAGAITGMGFFVAGLAAFIGPPIAGALIALRNGDFLGCQLFSGTCMLLAALTFAAAGMYRAKSIEPRKL